LSEVAPNIRWRLAISVHYTKAAAFRLKIPSIRSKS
jgi:hypothetical protein